MATPTYMGKYAEPAKQSDSVLNDAQASQDLQFPVAPDFVPLPRRADSDQAIEISASYLPRMLQLPGFRRMRAEDYYPVEFDLEHPDRFPASYDAAFVSELFASAQPDSNGKRDCQ